MGSFRPAQCSLIAILATAFTVQAEDIQDNVQDIEEILVTGSIRAVDRRDLSQSAAILTGEALAHARSNTLGDTLDRMPGISVSSYGPAVGRPVIRGLSGDRVRILVSGIGSIDASGSSPDHATAVDPATAESIEVLRGPSTLLFGNNAVGGVINVFDGRIPTKRPDGGSSSRFNAGYGSNGNEVTLSGWTTFALGENTLVHLDASLMDRGDMKIPGEAESEILLDFEGEEHDDGDGEGSGIAENTAADRTSGTVGITQLFDKGYLGFSISGLETDYGLPGHGHEEEHGEEEHEGEEEEAVPPVIDLDQVRFDMMGGISLDNDLIQKVEFRFAYADYEHSEIEGDEIAALYKNQGWEGRVSARHEQDDFSAIFGIQQRHRDFNSEGEEAFITQNETLQRGLFGVGYWDIGDWRIEAGGRYEFQKIEGVNLERKWSALSLSGSAIYKISETLSTSVLGFRTKRAPGAEELLSNGPHLATSSYQLGDRRLDEETATGIEFGLRYEGDKNSASVALYRTSYDDFLYERETGNTLDDLPIRQFTAVDATFWGLEAETHFTVMENKGEAIHFHLSGDIVRAEQKVSNEPLPRIPPVSVSTGIDYASQLFDASVQATWNGRQTRTAFNELATDGHVRVDLSVGYRAFGPDTNVELYGEIRNLFNAEIRHHTSALKDIVPEPGRDFRTGVRVKF